MRATQLEQVVRHRLPDRLYHWTMAAAVLTLLGTGFLPILGWKFEWVMAHWIAGLVLAALVVLHIVDSICDETVRRTLKKTKSSRG